MHWLGSAERSGEFRAAVEVVGIDPDAGYVVAVGAVLPDARIALDHST